jgi:hypothetical protein
VTRRVTDGKNPPLVRAVTFETFNPRPNQPVIINQVGGGAPSGAPNRSEGAPAPQPAAPARPRDPLGESLREGDASADQPLSDLQTRPPEDLDLKF